MDLTVNVRPCEESLVLRELLHNFFAYVVEYGRGRVAMGMFHGRYTDMIDFNWYIVAENFKLCEV